MTTRASFIPGLPAVTEPPLEHYRPEQPRGAAKDYVRRLTEPGGLVVDLFCQGPRFVEEAVGAGRRVLGFSANPLLLHAARLGLTAVDHQALRAEFTRLADSAKGDTPLGGHLASLYRTRCPVCQAPGTAEWFAWNRDRDRPFEKGVRCRRCGEMQVGPIDRDDVALAESFAPRGLPYYYALDRAAPLDHPARDRAAELVERYTPRNLSALMDLSRRVEGLEAGGVRSALMGLLVDCFDRCSKLHPYGEDRPRPRTLRVPVRYMERNVWRCFEERLSGVRWAGSSSAGPEAEDVDALVRGTRQGYALVARAAREVGEVVPVESVDLVLVDPPRPDGVFWALSALWTAWLWDRTESRAMRPFLRRRRFEWHWHWHALREALREIGPRLTDEGLLVMLFVEGNRTMLESASLAATSSGYRLDSWGYTSEVGYRLAWRWKGTGGTKPALAEEIQDRVIRETREAATSALRHRGEPSSGLLLHAAAHTRLAARGVLSSASALNQESSPLSDVAEAVARGLDAAPIVELAEEAKQDLGLWWLTDPPEGAETLGDRVERMVRRLLAERLVWRESDLINAVYARFSGELTPDLALVRVCIASYSRQDGQEVRLRPEDDLERRRMEIDEVREDLVALGQRLGFSTGRDDAWDVHWLEDDRETYVFIIAATAELASALLRGSDAPAEAQRCLVMPGGRAELAHLKLLRDPRLAQAAEAQGWQFVKFRHLRRLVAEEDLDRYAFKAVLGLDPVAEREHTQLTLF